MWDEKCGVGAAKHMQGDMRRAEARKNTAEVKTRFTSHEEEDRHGSSAMSKSK
jgi:hypothetical protein